MVNILQSYLLSESAEGQVTLPVCSTLNNLHFNKVTFTTVLPFCSDTSLPVLLSAIVTLFCTDPPSVTLDSRYSPNTHTHIWPKLDYTTLLGGRLCEHWRAGLNCWGGRGWRRARPPAPESARKDPSHRKSAFHSTWPFKVKTPPNSSLEGIEIRYSHIWSYRKVESTFLILKSSSLNILSLNRGKKESKRVH